MTLSKNSMLVNQFKLTHMKKFLKEVEFKFDYYFVIFLYNSSKVHRYHKYMTDKWGSKYTGL